MLLVVGACSSDDKGTEDDSENILDPVVAKVNTIPIYESQVVDVKMTVLQQTGDEVTDTEAIDMVISQILVLQLAQQNDLVASNAEVEKAMSKTLQQKGTTLVIFKAGITPDEYKLHFERARTQLTMRKVALSIASIQIKDEDAKGVFDKNRDLFAKDESTTYEEVADQVHEFIVQESLRGILSNLVVDLRNKSDIEYY